MDMSSKPVHCKWCGSDKHYSYACYTQRKGIKVAIVQPLKRYKRPKQQSAKEQKYQAWKEEVARPYLIVRDGNRCSCCSRPAFSGEKLDIEHTLGKGSHPGMKKDLDNLTLMCRWPCHYNKTNRLACMHQRAYT